MSNPFKKITTNAETSKSDLHSRGQQTETRTSSESCKTCGAPRPKKTNLVTCDYCRQPFMANVDFFKEDS